MTNTPHDHQFEENLKKVGKATEVPATPSASLLNACDDIFDQAASPTAEPATSTPQPAINKRNWSPFAWSTLGVAAGLALVAGVFLTPYESRTLQAAEVIQQLNQQLAENELLAVRIDGLNVDGASLEADLQLTPNAMAGSIKLVYNDPANPLGGLAVDAELGLTTDSSWIYVREFTTSNPAIAIFASQCLDDGRDVLLELPPDTLDMSEIFESDDLSLAATAFAELQEVIEAASQEDQELIQLTELPDGAYMLSMPLDNPASMASLEAILTQAFSDEEAPEDEEENPSGFTFNLSVGTDGEVAPGASVPGDAESDEQDDANTVEVAMVAEVGDEEGNEFFEGVTLQMIYQPTIERVTELSLTGFGENDGAISVRLLEDVINPTLLSADSLITEDTTIIDSENLCNLGAE
ncbi:MAG: hypothetical protein ACPGXK_16955 [Phycisphaerae bacterium]